MLDLVSLALSTARFAATQLECLTTLQGPAFWILSRHVFKVEHQTALNSQVVHDSRFVQPEDQK